MERLTECIQLLREKGYEVLVPDDKPDSLRVTRGGLQVVLGSGKGLEDLVADRTNIRQLFAEHRLNSCALMTFRDTADGDYISARLAFRAACYEQFLWSAQQAIEKYLKCILVLRRTPRPEPNKHGHRPDMQHRLQKGIDMIGAQALQLTKSTCGFIKYLDATALGARYFEISLVAKGNEHHLLDRAVWELRRYCTPSEDYSCVHLTEGELPPKIRLNGRLERVIDNPKHPGREALLWQNAFFGRRNRRRVGKPRWGVSMKNSSLFIWPQVTKEFLKYAQLTKEVVRAYEELAKSRSDQSVARKRKQDSSIADQGEIG
ncbi:MAG TPA: HEPN domain-containing protein [Bryobacteraceae bacterium]|nr:hypothetical protein [Bryobacterales bacterium]HRJ20468.1 HEPN domain-containing protein [Bryobacteraceae bacterium]